MAESKINLIFVAVLGCIFFLLAGCTNDIANPGTVSLPEVACQPEDVAANPPFTIAQTHTAVPPNTPLADQIEQFYGVDLIENRLANIAAFCNLYLLADDTAAAELLAHLCRTGVTPAKARESTEPPLDGESICAFQSEGFREVHFQQGRLVVSIWGDSGGWGVDEWVVAVNGRLPQE
ncbi:MAG: hypothetical protein CL608_16235 [Anaerolineaceae bacterium]|nr:hypothetical protein [Anaerolineaceae bacterium]